LTLNYDEPLSTFAFNFKLRRYTLANYMDEIRTMRDMYGAAARMLLATS
jgi:hypothetical protein